MWAFEGLVKVKLIFQNQIEKSKNKEAWLDVWWCWNLFWKSIDIKKKKRKKNKPRMTVFLTMLRLIIWNSIQIGNKKEKVPGPSVIVDVF